MTAIRNKKIGAGLVFGLPFECESYVAYLFEKVGHMLNRHQKIFIS